MSVCFYIEYEGKSGYSEGDLIIEPLSRWKKFLNLICIHTPNIRNVPMKAMTCRCGKAFVPNEFIYTKPGYWQEYY